MPQNPEREKLNAIFEEKYRDLKRLAAWLKGDRSASIPPSDLVHEAWIEMSKHEDWAFEDPKKFISLTATIMAHQLENRARRKKAQKRELVVTDRRAWTEEEKLALYGTIDRLKKEIPELGEVAAAKMIGGFTLDEIAVLMKKSRSEVGRQWLDARQWLAIELKR